VDCPRAEGDVGGRHSDVPVTTNFMVSSHQSEQDYFGWAPDMDVVSQDHYLDHRLTHPRAEQAFTDDLTRGVAGGVWLLLTVWPAGRVERRARRILRWMGAAESPTPIRSPLPEETTPPVFPSPPLSPN